MKNLVKNNFCEILSSVRAIFDNLYFPVFILIYFYMKNYIMVAAIASILLVPALFADTTGTGTTTSTGTTSTGVTSTGTIGTGAQCNTGTVQVNQAALLVAQQAFSTEVARLVGVKQSAYSGALSLTGAAQLSTMQSANQAFRTGFQTAIKTLSSVKQANRSHQFYVRECRKEVKQEKHEEKKEHKEEIKSQIKDLKDRIKEIQQSRKNGNAHR